jgi:hypothetical protein
MATILFEFVELYPKHHGNHGICHIASPSGWFHKYHSKWATF